MSLLDALYKELVVGLFSFSFFGKKKKKRRKRKMWWWF